MDVQVVLVQGTHAETLAVQQLPTNVNASYDPRVQRASLSVPLTTNVLARFQPGDALLRATAVGRAQWMRVPPPTVRERSVEIAPSARRLE